MSFFNETNYGRIIKMCEMIEGPMEKSANSNKATPEQWATMLQPLINLIEERIPAKAQPEHSEPEKPDDAARPEGMSRERLDYSIACSKADRAIRACEKVADELQRLKAAIPQ